MEVTRRQFLKAGAAGAAGATAALGFDLAEARAEQRELKIARTVETRSTCPYCSVSCGLIVHTLGDNAKNVTPSVVHIEGDPDHPINRGTLCPKGITLKDDITHRQRLTRPRVRKPGAREWTEISWDEAIQGIARHVKDTRDRCFVATNAAGQEVHRNPGMGMVAAAPTPTSSTSCSGRRAPRGAWSTAIRRPGSDTVPRWPVWPPPSAAAR
jgi:formate dehydrogenase major subunit